VNRTWRRSQLNRVNDDHVCFTLEHGQQIDAAQTREFQPLGAALKAVIDLETHRIVSDQFVADTNDYCTSVRS
jgi:hypothetical protein